MRSFVIAAAAGGLCVAAPQALACFSDPPDPPPTFWIESLGDTDMDGGVNFLLAQEVSLFNANITTPCSCGLGIEGAIPPGFAVVDVGLEIWNKTTGERAPIGEFNALNPGPQFSAAYNTLRDGTGETWFGFGGFVPTFVTPILGENEVLKVVFEIDVVGGIETLRTLRGTVGAGMGDGNALPQVDGDHPVMFFSPLENTLPSPATASALALLGLGAVRRRR